MRIPNWLTLSQVNESNAEFRQHLGWVKRLGRELALATIALLLPTMASAETRIVVVGDSLVAGFGLPAEAGLVPRLQAWLDERDADTVLVNAGVSGDTTAMGLARLEWSVGDAADAVILSLGANDVLRGLSPAEAESNLDEMLVTLRERGLPTLLAGMRASANLGPEYVEAFDRMYPELATKYDALLYPFLLEGVALDPELNQSDGIHPNAQGVQVIVEGIGPLVLELIELVQAH